MHPHLRYSPRVTCRWACWNMEILLSHDSSMSKFSAEQELVCYVIIQTDCFLFIFSRCHHRQDPRSWFQDSSKKRNHHHKRHCWEVLRGPERQRILQWFGWTHDQVIVNVWLLMLECRIASAAQLMWQLHKPWFSLVAAMGSVNMEILIPFCVEPRVAEGFIL